MPKSAARVLGLLPYRSRQDVAVRGAMARAARGEDGLTDGTWGREVSDHENWKETQCQPKVSLQGTGAGARLNRARPIREQWKKIDPSTKPKTQLRALGQLGRHKTRTKNFTE